MSISAVRFISLLFLVWAFHAQAQEREAVKIGLIYPLTGPMSSFGEDMAKAVPLLERKFNAEQSKYKFLLLLEDGKFGHTNAAITAAKKLVAIDGARFLVVGSSGEILQIAPYAESARILCVTGFSSNADVRNAGDFIFRTYIDAERGISILANEIINKNIERVAIISEESSFTLAIKGALEKFLGTRLVFNQDYAFGEADFKTLIAKAREKKPQAYYLNVSSPANFIALVRQLRANGLTETFYTYYTPSLKDVQEALGSLLNGTIYLDYPDAPDASRDFKDFLAMFERATGAEPRAAFNFRTNYNAVKVVYDAVMAAGPDPGKAKDFLYAYDRPSATGRLQFDANGDVMNLDLVLKTYHWEKTQ
ncbi:MAG TPA: ABC transporter substrate-binding protein [Oligoflexia bacterium]|nr:ABC transporter substrate-binding protein [Oligoflexia bacterium]